MRTLLMLGGSDTQVHAIERARKLGIRVVTCDNRPENPGHQLTDDYHEVSTTDSDGVLDLARRLKVDGVLAYASDPAALTAAYVAERLGLPSDPLEAVRRTQDKILLREAQRDAGLPTPAFVDASDGSTLSDLAARSAAGVVIKPTDASGSKGVTVLPKGARADEIARAVEQALAASRSGRVIAEEVWGIGTLQFGGDVLIREGELRFSSFGDQMMSPVPGSHIPIGVLCPTSAPADAVDEARRQAGSLVAALGLRQGVYNVEFRTDEDGRLTIIDLGARIGGNLLGIVHSLVTGVDLVAATILMALGEPQPIPAAPSVSTNVGHLVLHSRDEGVLESIDLSEDLRSITREAVIAAKPGDAVRPYRTSADRLGVIVIASENRTLLNAVYREPERFVDIRRHLSRTDSRRDGVAR